MQIVINAGGSGSRLWPISSEEKPKQFCKLVGEQTLLQLTYTRLAKRFAGQIWVSTNQKHLDLVIQQLPGLDPERILTEPAKRDTFAAVTAHSAVIAGQTSFDENIIFIPSDAWIQPEESVDNLLDTLDRINLSLDQDDYEIIIAGIKPTLPSTQFGYIQLDKANQESVYQGVAPVVSFKEKPNHEIANEFYQAGNYLWNFGLFAFKFTSLLDNLVKNDYTDDVEALQSIASDKYISSENFFKLRETSFDFGVLEHTKSLGVAGAALEVWDDIGNYEALSKYLPSAQKIEFAHGNKIQIAGKNNRVRLLDPSRKVAFVGVSNITLVETEEGIIVVNPDKSSEVKKVSKYFADK
jgi:mannose-1-phosphate guanylyltransferase